MLNPAVFGRKLVVESPALLVLLGAWLLLRSMVLATLADLESITGHHRYDAFVWASPRVLLTSDASVRSVQLVGRSPVQMELSVGCSAEEGVGTLVPANRIFERNFYLPPGCQGDRLLMTASRAVIPAHQQGSNDIRELSVQIFALRLDGRQMPLAKMAARAEGLYGIESAEIDTSPVGTLSSRWDAGWYSKIVHQGYRYDGDPTHQQHTAWPFLYPALSGLTARLFDLEVPTAMVGLNAILSLAALFAVYGVGRTAGLVPATALLPALWLCFNPFSYYLVAGVSEPLFLLLAAVCLLFLLRGRPWLAAGVAALLVATRFAGIASAAWVFFGLALATVPKQTRWYRRLPAIAVPALGVAADMLVKWYSTGYAFAAFDVRAAWEPAGLKDIMLRTDLRDGLPLVLTVTSLAAALFMAVRGALGWQELDARIRFLWLCGLSISVFTLVVNPDINAAGRYLLAAFPLVIAYLGNPRAGERFAVVTFLIGLGGSGAMFHTLQIWQGLPPH